MWQSIGLTLLLLLGHTLIRRLIHKSLLALGQSRQVSENRVLYVAHVFHFLLGCATLLVLAGVWGLDFSRLVVLASSFFAVLGVAMVAQWSNPLQHHRQHHHLLCLPLQDWRPDPHPRQG